MNNNILIVGMGITGNNLLKELAAFNPDTFDIKKHTDKLDNIANGYDFIFICVDTPQTEKALCDLTAIYDVIKQWKHYLKEDGVFVLKSTVLPYSCEKINKDNSINIVYSPEYYGNTQHCNNYYFNFTILSGNGAYKVQQLLQHCYDARHIFKIVDYKTAELAKYMENCFLAMKVSFCAQFYEITKKIGIKYEDLRECFILDPRINAAHTFIYNDSPFYDSHCLNKDVTAIAETYNAELLKAMINFNEKQKK